MSKGKSIEESEWKQEINLLLDAGFSVDSIIDYMRVQYGEHFARRTLYDYKENYYKTEAEKRENLPERLYDDKKYKWLDVTRIREAMVYVLVERIKQNREREKQIGISLKTTDDIVRELNMVLNDLKQDYVDIGIMQKGPERMAVDVTGAESVVGRTKIDDAFNGVPKEEISKIAGAIGRELIVRLRKNSSNHGDEDAGKPKADN